MKRAFHLGIIVFMTILCFGNLYSQLPSAPINLNADISFNGTDYEMVLTWQADTNYLLTDRFNIYIASGNTENPIDFTWSSTITRDGDETAIYTYSHTFTVTGEYSLYIAGQNGFGEGTASVFLHFHMGSAIISGRVVRDLYYLQPIANADITIKAMAPPDTTYYYYTTSNDSGYFEIEVPDGNYKVFVGGDYCWDIWYDDEETEETATEITAKYGYRTEIIIKSFQIYSHLVNGRVTDKKTGYPIYPATVDFMAFRNRKLIKTISVPTLSDGSYTVTLSTKYDYKILAYDNYVPNIYIPMYYHNAYDFLESELLQGNGLNNQANPNFELEEYPASLKKINGVVKDNNGNGVKSMLILYKHQILSGIRTITSDDEGNFTFNNLEPGKYIIRAIPYGSYTSGFYNTKDYVEPHWFDATLINVDENTEFINHQIVVNTIVYPDGKYLIEGWVLEKQNAMEGKKEKVQEDVYIAGAVKYLLNSKKEIVAVDTWGFSFPNIASDHYTLKVDKIGYEFYTSDDIYVNEIDTAKFVKVYMNKHPHTNPTISFKTTPKTEAFVGQSYSYDADVITNSTDMIRYDLIESPQGMTLNGSTGLINWTPNRTGIFSVTLEAYLLNNQTISAQQTWNIEVKEGINTAYLLVRVQNGTKKFPDATLKLYLSDFSSTFTATSDNNAKAFFAVPAGEYYLHLSGDLFEDCWYNNKKDFADADKIVLTAGDTVELWATVTEKPVIHKISGIVADKQVAIPDASVHFILETGEIRTVTTRTDGRFAFEIGKDTAFRAFAVKDGQYTAQYYSDSYDFSEARMMENVGTPMFDFINMEQLPKSTINIEGQILDESALPIPGVVVAYGGDFVDDGGALKFRVDFVNSTAAKDGSYKITVPISGKYFIRAYPANSNYYPAYYSDEVEPIYTWTKSKVIESTGSSIKDIFIKCKKVTMTNGAGSVSGKVEIILFNIMNFSYSQVSANGVTVFALDPSDNICKYTYTDLSAIYDFSNLELKLWKIVAEKIGLDDNNAQQTVTLSQSEPKFENILLFYSFGSSVDEDAERIMLIYPNPTNGVINIRFKEDNINNSIISVLDNLGNERISFGNKTSSNLSLDVSSLPSGAYFIRISRGMKIYTMPFIKIKD